MHHKLTFSKYMRCHVRLLWIYRSPTLVKTLPPSLGYGAALNASLQVTGGVSCGPPGQNIILLRLLWCRDGWTAQPHTWGGVALGESQTKHCSCCHKGGKGPLWQGFELHLQFTVMKFMLVTDFSFYKCKWKIVHVCLVLGNILHNCW